MTQLSGGSPESLSRGFAHCADAWQVGAKEATGIADAAAG